MPGLYEDIMDYNDQLAGATEFTDCISAEFPRYDTKQFDGEVTVTLGPWGMQSSPLLPSLQGPLWSVVVVPDRVQSMGQIELNCLLM